MPPDIELETTKKKPPFWRSKVKIFEIKLKLNETLGKFSVYGFEISEKFSSYSL